MQKNKILIRILALIALLAFLGVSILAAIPYRAGAISVSEAQRQQSQAQQKKEQAKAAQSAELKKRAEIDAQISSVQAEIDSYQAQIDEKVAKIEENEKELNKMTEDLQTQNEAYNERVKQNVKSGKVSYLEMLFNAKSPEDLILRLSVMKQMMKYDNKVIEEIEASMAEVEELQNKLIDEKAKVVSLKEEQDAKKQVLDGYRAESQAIIDDLQKDIEAFEAQYNAAKKAEEQARAAANAAANSGRFTLPANFVGGQFMWPSNTTHVTSQYGYRIHPVTGRQRFHSGVDIGAPYGSSIYASNSGTVVVAGYNSGGYGNYVVINHGGGYSTLYAHCSSLLVSAGQQVSRGQVIAKCGSTGMSTGPHVHFEIQYNGSTTNPMQYFR